MDRDLVQAFDSVGLRDAVLNHDGVQVLHVRKADKLIDVGVVALVSLEIGIRQLPLLMRLSEERNIQHVRLVRVDDAHLCPRHGRRNQVLQNRIGVNAIVDLCQLPFRP